MAETFSLHSSCDVEVYDLISELKIADSLCQMTVIYAMEISRMSREVGCYPDISIAYHIFIYYTCDYRIGRKKFFEVEIIEELSEVTNDPREVI